MLYQVMKSIKLRILKITIGSYVSFSWSVLLCNQIKKTWFIQNLKTLIQIFFLKSLQFIKINKMVLKALGHPIQLEGPGISGCGRQIRQQDNQSCRKRSPFQRLRVPQKSHLNRDATDISLISYQKNDILFLNNYSFKYLPLCCRRF